VHYGSWIYFCLQFNAIIFNTCVWNFFLLVPGFFHYAECVFQPHELRHDEALGHLLEVLVGLRRVRLQGCNRAGGSSENSTGHTCILLLVWLRTSLKHVALRASDTPSMKHTRCRVLKSHVLPRASNSCVATRSKIHTCCHVLSHTRLRVLNHETSCFPLYWSLICFFNCETGYCICNMKILNFLDYFS
jgi:hypothetical protein